MTDPAREKYEELSSMCIGCGRCLDVCPSHRYGGCDPVAVAEGDLKKVFDCVGCGACARVCEHTHPKDMMLAAYCIVIGKPIDPAFHDTGLARYPLENAPGLDLEPVWNGDDVYVMPGCTAKCDVPYVVYSASAAMKGIGVKACEVPEMTCCMYPIQFGIMTDDERRSYRDRMCERSKGKDLVMLCPGCAEITKRDGSQCEHIIEFLHRHLDDLPVFGNGLKVSLEPGCSALDFFDQMREVVEKMGFAWAGNEPGCCGKRSRKAAAPMMAERQKAAEDADIIVVGCPMCQSKYDAVQGGKPSVYITELVAAGTGDATSLQYHRISLGNRFQTAPHPRCRSSK